VSKRKRPFQLHSLFFFSTQEISLSASDHSCYLAEFQISHAAMRAEHQRLIVAQLALHNYPAEQAQSALDDYERSLRRIREE
jgi:hypothetical protein